MDDYIIMHAVVNRCLILRTVIKSLLLRHCWCVKRSVLLEYVGVLSYVGIHVFVL